MAQQAATHISESTPHKQSGSCFFRASCVRGVWDHQDAEGPPLLIVLWDLDHLRIPTLKVGVVPWGGRGVDKVTSRDMWQNVYSWPWCSTIPRQEPSESQNYPQHHLVRAHVSGPDEWGEGRGLLQASLYPRVPYTVGWWTQLTIVTLGEWWIECILSMLFYYGQHPFRSLYYVLDICSRHRQFISKQ